MGLIPSCRATHKRALTPRPRKAHDFIGFIF
jgi:hypothetical protein